MDKSGFPPAEGWAYNQTLQPPNYDNAMRQQMDVEARNVGMPSYNNVTFQGLDDGVRPITTQNTFPTPQIPILYQAQLGNQQVQKEETILRYKSLHLVYGVISIVFGGIVMIIDPLLPALFWYRYSIFPGGLFLLISGICSVLGNKTNNRGFLIASLVFIILAGLSFFAGYVVGIGYAVIHGPFRCSIMYYGCPSSFRRFFSLGFFNTIFGLILFIFVIWDFSLKCSDTCCRKRPKKTFNLAINPNSTDVAYQHH